MKTPDEIKKGLSVCATLDGDCENCPYDDGKQLTCVDRSRRDALAYIIQLESTYNQVSKALCGKENANLEEVLQADSQVKSRLAKAEKERDAAVESIHGQCEECVWNQTMTGKCIGCVHDETAFMPGIDNWEWRGVCEENTHDQP